MKTRSETAVATNGALVEIATIEHEGREFEANGAIIDPSGGLLLGYVSHGHLTMWSGATIAPVKVTGHARGFHGSRLTCYTTEYEGHRYSGRGSGEGMILRMRKGRAL